MLQVFYIDVVKIDRDVAYVAIHVCLKCMFQMFHWFQEYVVAKVDLYDACLCNGYTRML
jgi:hypothetical protein